MRSVVLPAKGPCARPGHVRAPLVTPWARPVDGQGRSLRRGLVAILCARLATNGGIRVVYPFLPAIAIGLRLPLHVVALLVAGRSMAGLAGPVLAHTVSRRGVRTLMVGGQLLLIAGCAMIVASPAAPGEIRIAVVAVGFVATGLARPMFDLPMQTWVSAQVPPADRARALGVTELGWALSMAVTVPTAGVLIDRLGWRSPFILVAGMAGIGVVAVISTVSPQGPALSSPDAPPAELHPLLASTTRLPTGLAVCVGAGLAVAAGESLLIVYGEWLTSDFGLSVTQIGASALVIVAAELTGGMIVISVADRLGLCRTLFAALLVSTAIYAALGLVGARVTLALATICALFVAFEITVVVLLAFASTVVRHAPAQARLLGRLMAGVACGNVVGALIAPLAYARGGIGISGVTSAVLAVMALTVLWGGSRPRRQLGVNSPSDDPAPKEHELAYVGIDAQADDDR